MELISAEKVKQQYKELWPFMMEPLCFDSRYQIETIYKIEQLIGQCDRYKKISFRDEIADCDNIALALQEQFVNEAWIENKEHLFPCAFGRTVALKLDGERQIPPHMVTTFYAREGVYIFAPQLRKLWKADKEKDILILVLM